jgi:hypothetical protein
VGFLPPSDGNWILFATTQATIGLDTGERVALEPFGGQHSHSIGGHGGRSTKGRATS